MSRAIFSRTALLALLITVGGCGKDTFADLTAGISKDSVTTLLGGEQPLHQENFLKGGVFYEVLYFGKDGAAYDSTTAIRTLDPLVMADGKVAGWGWKYFDETAAAKGLPVAPK